MKNSNSKKIKDKEVRKDNMQHAASEIEILHKHYFNIFHNIPLGILLFDDKFKILETNNVFLQIFSTETSNLKDFNLTNLPDKRLLPAFKQVSKGFEGFYDGAYQTISNNQEIYISLHTKPYTFDFKGKTVKGGIALVKDITENTIAEVAVNKSYDTFQRVTDNVNAFIFVIDPEKREMLFMNRKATEVYGEKIGKISPQDFFCKSIYGKILKETPLPKDNIALGKFFEKEYYEKITDQYFQLSYGFIEWINGKKVILLTSIDISDVKRVQKKYINQSKELEEVVSRLKEKNEHINKQSEELKISSGIKNTMFSIIAHDLRGPVGNITTALDIIRDDIDELNKTEIIEIIKPLRNSAGAIYNLLVNLLFWAKNESGETFFIKDEIVLNDIVEDVLALFIPNMEVKNIELIDKTDKEYCISADEHMLNTIIRNLVSNAIKYSKEGGKIILDTKEVIGKSGNMFVRFSVEDKGIGIAKENISKIFSSKELFSTYGTNNEKGTGIGIILIKDFVERHDGYMEIESDRGKGTKVSVFFPAD